MERHWTDSVLVGTRILFYNEIRYILYVLLTYLLTHLLTYLLLCTAIHALLSLYRFLDVMLNLWKCQMIKLHSITPQMMATVVCAITTRQLIASLHAPVTWSTMKYVSSMEKAL